MNVIKRKTLAEFWTKYPRAEAALRRWFKIARKAHWRHFEDTKRTFGSADVAVVNSGRKATIFDVSGNSIRIIALVDYARQTMLVTHVLTHGEYNRNVWKEQL